MDTTVNDFIAQFLSPSMFVAPAGIYAFLWWLNSRVLSRFHPNKTSKIQTAIKVFKRALPALPMVFGFFAAWVPGALPLTEGATWGERLFKGLWCGFLASLMKKAIDQTFLGKDKHLDKNTKADE